MNNGRANTLQASFRRPASRVAIRRAADYEGDPTALLVETLRTFKLPVEGKRVLLKPNLVGLDPEGMVNTHPLVVVAAREAFLRLGASRVTVAEGPALERDTEAVIESVRLRDYLDDVPKNFVDLNVDDVSPVKLQTRASPVRELYLPVSVLKSDLVVSLPKLKTHHWAGVTLSLKNMFGVVPGSCYGWPKNILHWAGIERILLDLNSAVRPDFVIVDGIRGMEGNGPIQGTPKQCGVLVLGDDPVAVDATCTRIMGLVPERVGYLQRAGLYLGHVREEKIHQMGESIGEVRTPFKVLDSFQRLRQDGTVG
jgi:uncharacterized protein (DUF362 family)